MDHRHFASHFDEQHFVDCAHDKEDLLYKFFAGDGWSTDHILKFIHAASGLLTGRLRDYIQLKKGSSATVCRAKLADALRQAFNTDEPCKLSGGVVEGVCGDLAMHRVDPDTVAAAKAARNVENERLPTRQETTAPRHATPPASKKRAAGAPCLAAAGTIDAPISIDDSPPAGHSQPYRDRTGNPKKAKRSDPVPPKKPLWGLMVD